MVWDALLSSISQFIIIIFCISIMKFYNQLVQNKKKRYIYILLWYTKLPWIITTQSKCSFQLLLNIACVTCRVPWASMPDRPTPPHHPENASFVRINSKPTWQVALVLFLSFFFLSIWLYFFCLLCLNAVPQIFKGSGTLSALATRRSAKDLLTKFLSKFPWLITPNPLGMSFKLFMPHLGFLLPFKIC